MVIYTNLCTALGFFLNDLLFITVLTKHNSMVKLLLLLLNLHICGQKL